MKHTLTTLLTFGILLCCPLSACGSIDPITVPDDYDNPAKAEDYYHLDTTYGFEVYAWDRGNNNWRCSIAQSNANGLEKAFGVVKELYPVSLGTMRKIIDSYVGFAKNESVIVCIIDYPMTAEGLHKAYAMDENLWDDIDFVRESIGLEKMFS